MQGLRVAYDHMIDSGFEELVRQADAAEALVAAAHAGGSPQQQQQQSAAALAVGPRKPGAVQTAEMSLLRRPAVFTLAIVWDSPQVCAHLRAHA